MKIWHAILFLTAAFFIGQRFDELNRKLDSIQFDTLDTRATLEREFPKPTPNPVREDLLPDPNQGII